MKYLIGLVLAIAVIIFIIIRLLTGGGEAPGSQPADLTSYATTGAVMRYTIKNPVQAASTHREIQITVGRDEAVFRLYRGYDDSIMKVERYSTGQSSYDAFLHALEKTGRYTEGNHNESVRDERGYCALGNRYVYEIIDGDGNVVQHLWSTTCDQQTFNGNAEAVEELFREQIPDFDQLTTDVDY